MSKTSLGRGPKINNLFNRNFLATWLTQCSLTIDSPLEISRVYGIFFLRHRFARRLTDGIYINDSEPITDIESDRNRGCRVRNYGDVRRCSVHRVYIYCANKLPYSTFLEIVGNFDSMDVSCAKRERQWIVLRVRRPHAFWPTKYEFDRITFLIAHGFIPINRIGRSQSYFVDYFILVTLLRPLLYIYLTICFGLL